MSEKKLHEYPFGVEGEMNIPPILGSPHKELYNSGAKEVQFEDNTLVYFHQNGFYGPRFIVCGFRRDPSRPFELPKIEIIPKEKRQGISKLLEKLEAKKRDILFWDD